MFDNPGRIFPAFFDGPGFFDISGVEEVSIDVSGLLEEWKSNDGKTKGGALGLGALISNGGKTKGGAWGLGALISAIFRSGPWAIHGL